MSPTVPRLKRRAQFLKVARSGCRWAAPGLVLQVLDRQDSEETRRAGFTVSKKVGNAVMRNRARRRLKAAAEHVLPECARAGHDYVLIGRTTTIDRPFDALKGDIETAIAKARLQKSKGEKRQVSPKKGMAQ